MCLNANLLAKLNKQAATAPAIADALKDENGIIYGFLWASEQRRKNPALQPAS